MKILWLINIPLPEISALMNEKQIPYGSWLVNVSKKLSEQKDIELSIAFPHKDSKTFMELTGKKITYFAFKPIKETNDNSIDFNPNLEAIINKANPDIVHIYGTEQIHTLLMVNICNKKSINVIISIQGLVSIISKHLYSDLSWRVIHGFTLRNLLRHDNIAGLEKAFEKRGKNEIKAIRNVNYLIGRTTWDKVCVSQYNPNARYYCCNEILREEFYNHLWNIELCEKYSIFISQAHYPIKGLHYVLEAMPLILKRFPQTKVYISGKNITKSETIKDKILMTYYGKYIKNKIRELGLENNIVFTGPLDEKMMCERFLNTHVFISASTVENESNSLSEAKILGVPCVVSYVGGVIDRIKHYEDGFLYQHDAPYMLAHYVCEIFGDQKLALKFSQKVRNRALEIHDIKANIDQLIKIYRDTLLSGTTNLQ